MARQTINTGASANDGTGDSLRIAGNKINQNFQEIYGFLGESDQVSPYLLIDSDGIIFNGDSVNLFKTKINVTDPTQSNTITFPDSSGVVSLSGSTQTLTNKTLDSAQLSTPEIKDDDSSHNYQIIPGSLSANQLLRLPSMTDSDTFVVERKAQVLENKILDSCSLNFPKVNEIVDTNGATITQYYTVAGAVNYVSLGNEAAGYNASIYADGADTNVSLSLGAKNDGAVTIDNKFALANLVHSGLTIDKLAPLCIFNSAVAANATLDDGTVIGELKYFVNKGAGTVTVTPTNFAGGVSTTFTANQAGFMIWTGANWHLASKQ